MTPADHKTMTEKETRIRPAVFLIIAVVLIFYHNSFTGEFLYDDLGSIVDNPSIRSVFPLSETLRPPQNTGTIRRPVVNFTLAVNYAISGLNTWSYHLFNLLIHMAAALTLFGIARRTFRTRPMTRFHDAANGLALAVALIWAIHPLQTESVTYVIQRCESLMGLFFFLTLYTAVRGWQSEKPGWWHIASVVACLLGVGSKEVMAVAPILVLIYEATFIRHGFLSALRRSWPLYLGYLVAWGVLAWIVTPHDMAGALAQSGTSAQWSYLITQSQIIPHYIRLVFWPSPLVFDYMWPPAGFEDVWLSVLIVLTLLALTAWGVLKKRPWGFCGAWFFLILSVTSAGFFRLGLAYEHRMYLPLAAIAALVAPVFHVVILRFFGRSTSTDETTSGYRSLERFALLLIILLLGVLTTFRNFDYQSPYRMWSDTVTKRPENPRARFNLGLVLARAGRPQEALPHFEKTVQAWPDHADAQLNLGTALYQLGRKKQAVRHLQASLKLNPTSAETHLNLGIAFAEQGDTMSAVSHFRNAIRLDPELAAAQIWLDRLAAEGK